MSNIVRYLWTLLYLGERSLGENHRLHRPRTVRTSYSRISVFELIPRRSPELVTDFDPYVRSCTEFMFVVSKLSVG